VAALSQTLLKELAIYYHCKENASTIEMINYLKDFHASLDPFNKVWLQLRWNKLTETERRIFESPENYSNVICEWYRSSS